MSTTTLGLWSCLESKSFHLQTLDHPEDTNLGSNIDMAGDGVCEGHLVMSSCRREVNCEGKNPGKYF